MRTTTLEETVSSTDERTALSYQRTGDSITLPYTEVVQSENPYATTLEKVNPYLNANWVGNIDLDPIKVMNGLKLKLN